MGKTLTIKRLSQLAGVKPRTLQFWTLNGVIECEPETRHEGSGKPRRYGEVEIAITLILSHMQQMPFQTAALRDIAERLREIAAAGSRHKIRNPYVFRFGDPQNAPDTDGLYHELSERAYTLNNEGKRDEAYQLERKAAQLELWSEFEFARRGPRMIMRSEGRQMPVGNETMLALSLDDLGNWDLIIEPGAVFKEIDLLVNLGEKNVSSSGVWSLRLLLNLTRIFAPLRTINKSDPEGEVA